MYKVKCAITNNELESNNPMIIEQWQRMPNRYTPIVAKAEKGGRGSEKAKVKENEQTENFENPENFAANPGK